eukprot:1191976-Prorocentrum_minimum.AAC.7
MAGTRGDERNLRATQPYPTRVDPCVAHARTRAVLRVNSTVSVSSPAVHTERARLRRWAGEGRQPCEFTNGGGEFTSWGGEFNTEAAPPSRVVLAFDWPLAHCLTSGGWCKAGGRTVGFGQFAFCNNLMKHVMIRIVSAAGGGGRAGGGGGADGAGAR